MDATRQAAPPTTGANGAHANGVARPRYTRMVAAQSLPQIVFILANTGTVLFHRSSAESLEDDELAGTTIYDYIVPAQREFFRQALAFVFEHSEAFGFELGGLGPPGTSSWFQCRLAPNVKDGRVVSATLVANDVTAYKQRELELEQELSDLRQRLSAQTATPAPVEQASPTTDSEGLRLHDVTDQAGEAVFVSDAATGRIIDANETACRWMGMAKEQLLSRSVHDFHGGPPLHLPETSDDPFTETRVSARPHVLEGVCRRRDGSTFAVESHLSLVTVGGRQCNLAIVRDAKRRAHTAHQLRDFQDRYRNLFDDVREAVFVTARNGEIVEANEAALTLFRCGRDEVIDLPVHRRLVFRPEDVRRFQEDTIQKGRAAEIPVQIRHTGGFLVPATISSTPLRMPDGTVRGYQCILRAAGPETLPGPTAPVTVAGPAAVTVIAPAAAAPRASQPSARVATASLVLLVTSDQRMQAEAEQALQRAGIPTATATDAPGAVRELKARGEEVGALVIEVAAGRAGQDAFREILRMPSRIPIVVVGEEVPLSTAQRLTLNRPIEFLPGPAHPLALVQRVRAALGR